MTGTRINLWIYVLGEDGRTMYHTMHLGIFPTRIVPAIVAGLDVRGLAFHSDFADQVGIVDVMTFRFGGKDERELLVATKDYTPRRMALAEV